MIRIYLTYFVSMTVTAVLMAAIAVYSWRNRKTVPGAPVYFLISLFLCLLEISEILFMLSPDNEKALFWFNIRFIFFAFLPVLWIVFVLHYSGKPHDISKRIIVILCIIPLLTQVMIWTNSMHGLWVVNNAEFYRAGNFLFADTTVRVMGLWGNVHNLYTYTVMFAGIILLLHTSARLYNRQTGQAVMLGAGTLVMITGSLFPTFNLVPAMKLNPMPQCFAIGSILIAWSIYHHRFLKEVPVFDRTERAPFSVITLFILMIVGIITAGYINYNNFREITRTEMGRELLTIADLKVSEIKQWRNERIGDGNLFYENRAFNNLVENFFNNPGDTGYSRQISSWLNKVQSSYNYDQLMLIDSAGIKHFSIPEKTYISCNDWALYIEEARRTRDIIFTDFHSENPGKPVHLSLIVPLGTDSRNGRITGYIILVINPENYLYPLIQRWPTLSETAETLLVRREGDDVLFLNELRFRTGTALKLRIPVTKEQLPSAMAVQGIEGVVEGLDYRGEHVAAALRSVPGTSWHLVAKIDNSEFYRAVKERFWIMILVVVVLISAIGSVVGYLWQRQSERFYREQYESAEALRESGRRLKEAQEMTHLGYWSWDIKTGSVEWTDEVFNIFSLDREKFTPQIDSILNLSPWPEDHNRNIELINRAMADHGQGSYEQKFLRPDNSVGYYYSTFHGNYNEKGDLVTMVGTVIDITERKVEEEKQHKINDRLSLACRAGGIGIWELDIINNKLIWDDQMFAIYGISPDKFSGTYEAWRAGVHPDDLNKSEEELQKAISGEKTFDTEFRVVWLDGSIHTVRALAVVQRDSSGQAASLIGTNYDITDLKKMEKAIQESEEKFRNLFEHSPVGKSLTAINGTININQTFCSLLGYSLDELKGLTWMEITHPDDIEYTQKIIDSLVKGESSSARFQKRYIHKNGSIIWADVSSFLQRDSSGKPLYFITALSDITERKLAEDRLIKSEERYRTTLDNMLEGCQMLDFDWEYIYINNTAEKQNKHRKDEMLGKKFTDIWPGVETTQVFRAIRRSLEERVSLQMENEFIFSDGSIGWFDLSIQPVPEGVFILSIDITERKSIEEKLLNAYARLERMFSSNVIGVAIADSHGALFDVNDYYLNLLGYTREEFEKGTIRWDECTPPEYSPSDAKALEELRNTGVSAPYEKEYLRKDGTRVSVLIADVLLPGPDEQIFALIIDVTERKKAEKERKYFTEELERSNFDLQQFAYVASHDLQEPLRMVSSYLQLIERRYKNKLDKDADEFINYAVDGAKRMQALIVGLLDFSRIRTHGKPFTEINLTGVINAVLKDLEIQIKEEEAIVEFNKMPVINADETQITRLFQNLLQNAIKYRRNGVKPHIVISSEKNGTGYKFCVSDNGIGIEKQYFERIFTIFQRLHARDEYPGTGIGLAICKRIVERHGGKIWLESQSGEGTSFYFNIPGGSQ